MSCSREISVTQRQESPERAVCEWIGDEIDIWDAQCGARYELLWEFTDGNGPAENKFQFCPFCGKPLKEVRS